MRELTGASSAAELARQILNQVHGNDRRGLVDLGFPAPEGYRSVPLCALSGKRATAACDLVFDEWFRPGEEPKELDDTYLRLAIDVRNGLLAHSGTPKKYIERRTFVNLPQRYADWASQAGLPQPPGGVSHFGETTSDLSRHLSSTGTVTSRGRMSENVELKIVAPGSGLTLLHDASQPSAYNTIALQAEVTPPIPEVLWIVDGKPFQLAPYPYTVRWPLRVGDHVIQARAPLSKELTPPVRIRVE
jgi:penicillin-binding protein 1C